MTRKLKDTVKSREKTKELFTMMFYHHLDGSSPRKRKKISKRKPIEEEKIHEKMVKKEGRKRLSLAGLSGSSSLDTGSESLEDPLGLFPSDALVSDGDTVLEFTRSTIDWGLLGTLVEVGLDHDTNDSILTVGLELAGNLIDDKVLVSVVLLGVAVGAVNHDVLLDASLLELLLDGLDVVLVVVWSLVSTTEDDEAVGVSSGSDNSDDSGLGDGEEMVRTHGGSDGINGNTDASVGSVLEANWEGKTRGEFSVELGLGGSGTDGTDGEEISEELRGDGVEHFGGQWDAEVGQLDKQGSGQAETGVDVEGAVDMGIVDETLPSNCGTGLLEVGTHDNQEFALVLFDLWEETVGVFEGGFGVVDGAWANDDQESVGFTIEDGGGFETAVEDGLL